MIWTEEEEEEDVYEINDSKKDNKQQENDQFCKNLTQKEKIINLIKEKYYSIKDAIKNNNYKKAIEDFNELIKNNDKINSILKIMPSYYYECFALIEESINSSNLIKLSKENSYNLNKLKKQLTYHFKKNQHFSNYKKSRKNEEELEEELSKMIQKEISDDESSDDFDIIELIKRDEDKTPIKRRLKWVKKIKREEEIINKNPIIKETKNKKIMELENQNKKLENKIIELENNIIMLNKKINEMKNIIDRKIQIINDSKIKNEYLNKELKRLDNIVNNENPYKRLVELMDKIKELKSILPFDLMPGEKLMTVIFVSVDQTIHYSVICKNTDIFTRIENLLYKQYPEYRDKDNYFLVNGDKIKRFCTLDENNIDDNNIITLYPIE